MSLGQLESRERRKSRWIDERYPLMAALYPTGLRTIAFEVLVDGVGILIKI